VDEASSDSSHDIMKANKLASPSNNITIIHNRTPKGLAYVANHCLSLARGKYILRLDADDWLDESALLSLVTKIESHQDAGLAFGNYFYTDHEGGILGVEFRDQYEHSKSSHYTPPHGACTLISVRALKSIGGYSTDINAQDGWDAWFRLKNCFKILQVATPVFYYRQHSSSLSTNNQRLIQARNTIFNNLRMARSGNYAHSCLAIIPAKQSYKHWHNVPMSHLQDISLLERSILSAVNAKCVTHIIVTSESNDVINFAKDICKNYDRNFIFHIREECSHVDPAAIIRLCLTHFVSSNQFLPDITLFLSIHSPFRTSALVDCAFNQLIYDLADSVLSVNQHVEPVLQKCHDRLKILNPGRFSGLAHDTQAFYSFNGSVIGMWTPADISKKSNLTELLGEKIAYLEVSRQESIQVKTINDLNDLNLIYSRLQSR
jgi:CMP-N-acetylneuraminic acid synthetase